MHNIDRTLTEYTPEMQTFETEQFEYQPEATGETVAGEVFGETELMELAAGLLEVQNEQELDRFLGGYIGGPTGAKIGGQLASAAGQMFGLELEGLSSEDQEFEVAKGFVRFAGEAVKNATAAAAGADPRATATAAAVAAAKRHAPGLLSATAGAAAAGL